MEETIKSKSEDKASQYYYMFADYPDVVNIQQLQKMLGVGYTFAYKLVSKGIIKSLRIGREYKILKSFVIEYILNNVN